MVILMARILDLILVIPVEPQQGKETVPQNNEVEATRKSRSIDEHVKIVSVSFIFFLIFIIFFILLA